MFLVLLVAVLVPPWINVGRYRVRVVDSISRALGRNVSASGISLRLLPRPGLVLSGFVVADDPAYGAEAMLRAEQVAAYIRLSSLWRGRLEIGTLELDNPSLNLVRGPDGHWNVEELIQRTSQVSSAPTTARHAEVRPRFPYIEATGGRINFKLGQVKKAFSFTDADFALWRESETEWGLRLLAKPMRTDVEINDTGILRVEGRFQSANQLRNTPMVLKAEFSNGQLGQVTKLIYGRDRGWRGGTSATANLTGTPAALSVVLDATIDDFRRYDIALGQPLHMQAHCTGTFSTDDDSLNDVLCESPIKPGTLRITGNAKNWGADSYQIGVTAQQLPMDRIVSFARHVKKDLPLDLNATGEAEAAFEVRKAADEPVRWAGGGRTSHVALHSAVLGNDLQIGEMLFTVPGAPSNAAPASRRPNARVASSPPAGFALLISPFPLSIGGTSPAVASGFFDEENYRATLSGDAELTRLLQVARALGIGTPGIGLAGGADVEVDLAGAWAGFSAPVISGQMQLRNASAELQGINEPLHIVSAQTTIANQAVNVSALSGAFGAATAIGGSASFPLHCTTPETCAIHFDLHSSELSLARVNQLLNPAARSQPWYHLLAIGQQQADTLLKLHADGKVEITHFQLARLMADNFQARVVMDAGKVKLDILRSDVLGGHHTGTWTSDFTTSPPRYAGGGVLQKIFMDQLSTLMHENWATGQTSGKYALSMQGKDAAGLLHSATGSADFTWTGGSLRKLALDNRPAPLTFSNLAGILNVGGGKLSFDNCEMKTAGGVFNVKGVATYDRQLNFTLQRSGGTSYSVAGPLDQPQVTTVPASPTQAQLR
jgi:AsmA family/AsmA-like C-terminal region